MRVFSIILALRRRFWSWIATGAARESAIIGPRTRFGAGAEIFNIHGDRSRVKIGADGRVFAHEGRIEIGDWFYLGAGSTIWSSDPKGIKIGNRVLVSSNVAIHDTNSHPMDAKKRFAQTEAIWRTGHPRTDPGIRAAPVTMGDDVWIGTGAIIMKGVTIGDRSIISAGAIVRSDVPADSLVRADFSNELMRLAAAHQ
ncbi:DapH/DapD/GlmU-related protein [Mesorhizobium sp.]|uniref:DapH/DapD/GlmU-related protein n=1 Tax=Mesorhizobium sp. TaxID=1871066 RepID=UPI0011F45B10|nr:DapH/DapD/GlmU-related protein [Mesorhizobium sp.]TIN80000.1 MAG: acyltransferase [Mesorhizobium sp.]